MEMMASWQERFRRIISDPSHLALALLTGALVGCRLWRWARARCNLACRHLLVLNYGWAFVQKPFVPLKLVKMITDVLHSANRSQLGGQEFDSRKDIRV